MNCMTFKKVNTPQKIDKLSAKDTKKAQLQTVKT